MTTKLVTFKTNHTIIADVVSETDTHISLKQPLQIVVQPSKEGTSIAFVPFLEVSKEFKTGVSFSKGDVLVISEPIDEIAEQYRQVFSKIQLATSLPPL
jgi:uncharacterized protein YlzI (FlbEa/FlbD family)